MVVIMGFSIKEPWSHRLHQVMEYVLPANFM